jgi:5'/3'-nucleotidase SurE
MTNKSPQGGWLLLTNDDGIEAPGFRMMAQALNKAGHSIIAFAPAENNSAAGMRINLMQPMVLASLATTSKLSGASTSRKDR